MKESSVFQNAALVQTTGASVPEQNVYDLSHRFSPEQTHFLLLIALVLGGAGFLCTRRWSLRTAAHRVWG